MVKRGTEYRKFAKWLERECFIVKEQDIKTKCRLYKAEKKTNRVIAEMLEKYPNLASTKYDLEYFRSNC